MGGKWERRNRIILRDAILFHFFQLVATPSRCDPNCQAGLFNPACTPALVVLMSKACGSTRTAIFDLWWYQTETPQSCISIVVRSYQRILVNRAFHFKPHDPTHVHKQTPRKPMIVQWRIALPPQPGGENTCRKKLVWTCLNQECN